MARMLKWLALAALGLSLTGCVSQEKYAAAQLRAQQLEADKSSAEADAQSARAQAQAYKNQLDSIGSSGNTREAIVGNLTKQVSDLESELASIREKYTDLLSHPQVVTVGGGPLPAQLTNELSNWAQSNPDIVEFNPSTGVVKFKSDVTFSSGSTDLSPKAKDAIRRFSDILNSSGAAGYELMIEGHTDNTKIVKQATLNQGNFDNWYLSAHRAISVGAELVTDGISRSRLGVAGFADQRPIASNATEAGKSINRRVEILILPTTAHQSAPSSAGPIPVSHRTAPAAETSHRYDKDSSSASIATPLSK